MAMAMMVAIMVMVEMFDSEGDVKRWRDGCKMWMMVANNKGECDEGQMMGMVDIGAVC